MNIDRRFKQSTAPLTLWFDARRDAARVRLQYGYDTEEFTVPSGQALERLKVGYLRESGGVFVYGNAVPQHFSELLAEFRQTDGVWGLRLERADGLLLAVADATDAYNALEDDIAEALRLRANKFKRLYYHLKKTDPLPDEPHE